MPYKSSRREIIFFQFCKFYIPISCLSFRTLSDLPRSPEAFSFLPPWEKVLT